MTPEITPQTLMDEVLKVVRDGCPDIPPQFERAQSPVHLLSAIEDHAMTLAAHVEYQQQLDQLRLTLEWAIGQEHPFVTLRDRLIYAQDTTIAILCGERGREPWATQSSNPIANELSRGGAKGMARFQKYVGYALKHLGNRVTI